jgi:hypothetical protein
MILLDTHVVAEPLRPNGDPAVLAWLDAQIVETLYLSAISLAELRYGVAVLPDGKRKDSLRASLEGRIVPVFGPRICRSTRRRPRLTPFCALARVRAAKPSPPSTVTSRPLRRPRGSRWPRGIPVLSKPPGCRSSIRGHTPDPTVI